MQAKASMTTFLFKEFLSFFKMLIPGGISQTNHHLLILDTQCSWVTCHIKNHRIRNNFGLDMIALFSHTSHGFQPLNVSTLALGSRPR
jgi:hypothetical protein